MHVPAQNVSPQSSAVLQLLEKIQPFRKVGLYFVASLLALVLDMVAFSFCIRLAHLSWAASATTGFTIGALANYLISIRWVFQKRCLADKPATELFFFILVGVAALGVTQVFLWIGVSKLHLLPELAKLGAAGATFVFNYVVRENLLFKGASQE